MGPKRMTALLAAAVVLAGMPLARASEPDPVLWEGRIVDAGGKPAEAEVVAFARPAGADLRALDNALVEVARTNTDPDGHYVLRAGRTSARQAVEDEAGWTNVMVAAFGKDGSMSLATDSLAWQPTGRGYGMGGAQGESAGRWVSTPSDRIAARRGVFRSSDQAAELGHERPAVMVLSDKGAKKFAAATPPPMREVGMCTGPHKTEDLGVHYTPVGELHLEQAWNGAFDYTNARSTSFQVGVRAEGGSWSVGGSTSSVRGSESSTGVTTLAAGHMYTFDADMIYRRFTWKCNRAETWRWVESVEPVEWGGGIRQTLDGRPPRCNPKYQSPIPPFGHHSRGEGESITLEGAVSVAGFSGSMTSTVAKGVLYSWNSEMGHQRFLCGSSGYITRHTRIASLP